ncbi:MAG: glycosyltransferase [Bacteroidetes bacterium]|nr:glycosyltransferase [Bacteroidota bacterium]
MTPLVSVLCQAYNHGEFIEQCLKGIMMQETSFSFEVLVHDDASTDNTADIIKKFELQYPEIIKPIYQTENQFSQKKKVFSRIQLPRAKGKYIAICEGDDYWTDPLKLQKQVDFLEANPDYVICYHDVKAINEEGSVIMESKIGNENQRDFSSEELSYNRPFIMPLSVVFRNLSIIWPEETKYVLNFDTFLFSILGQYGNGKYINDIQPANYRHHSGGIWSAITNQQKTIAHITTFYWIYQYYFRIGDTNRAQSYLKIMLDLVLKIDNSLKLPVIQAESKIPDVSQNSIMSLIKIIIKKICNKIKKD